MKRRIVLIVLGVIGIIVVSLFLVLGIWMGPHSVQQIVSGMFDVSQPADIQRTSEIASKYLSLKYPGNWRIDTTDPKYDPEKYFDINAPGQGKFMVLIFSPNVTPRHKVDGIVQDLKKLVMNAKQAPFEFWGSHEGYGVQLSGLVVGHKGRIRCFGIRNSEATIVVIETRHDDEEVRNRDGYELISRTFKLKGL